MQPFPVHQNFYKKIFFSSSIKMDKKNANFGDKKTKQVPFTKAKKIYQDKLL